MYDTTDDIKEIEAALVERITNTRAYVSQMDEHGSCKINFPTGGEVIVEYRDGMIAEVKAGKRIWQHEKTCDLIRLLNEVTAQQPLNPIAAIARVQRMSGLQNEIEYNMRMIRKWIQEM